MFQYHNFPDFVNDKKLMRRLLEFSIEMNEPIYHSFLKCAKKYGENIESDRIFINSLVVMEYDNKALVLGRKKTIIVNVPEVIHVSYIYVYKEYRKQGICVKLLKKLIYENNGFISIACNNLIFEIMVKYKLPYVSLTLNTDGTMHVVYLKVLLYKTLSV